MPTLTPAQQEMVAIAKEVAAQIAPQADGYDRTGTFPTPFYQLLHQSGYLGFVVPREFGGRGASLYDMVLCQEELAKGCGSTPPPPGTARIGASTATSCLSAWRRPSII